MNVIRDVVSSNKRNIPYKLYKQEKKTDTLTIILPGSGYTSQAPLLHYTTGVMFTKGNDVLQVNYQYSQEVFTSLSEHEFTSDVQSVIETVLKNENYTNFVIVAKSIGSIALTYLLRNPNYRAAKAIWLTPLIQRTDVNDALLKGENNALCFIGDQDPFYNKKKIEEMKSNHQISIHVIEGVNHSLEFEDDIFNSIDVLKGVIAHINEF